MNPFEEPSLCDDALTAHFMFDINNEKLLSANPRAVELSGFALNELLRKRLRDLFHAESIEQWTAFVDDMRRHESLPLQAGFNIDVKGEAEPISVHLSATRLPSRSKSKDRALVLITAKDSRYVEARSLYRQVFNNLSQSLYVKDKHLNFVAVNRVYCAEIGRPPDEILGLDDFALFPKHVAEKQDADEHQILEKGRCLIREEQTDIGGRPHTLHVVKTPVYAPNGDIEGVLAMRWDVTSEHRRQELQLQKKKTDAIGRLAGGIAHHFNNLLTIIRGNCNLARTRLADRSETGSEAVMAMLEQAEAATHRGAELVRNLLAFAKRLPTDFASVNLNNIVNETIVTLGGMSNVRINAMLETAVWTIRADAEQLRHLMMSICVNALEAMKDGGELTISTANVHFTEENLLEEQARNSQDEVLAPLSPNSRPGEFVHLRIRDTGSGIPREFQPHIFEPFFTTKTIGKGTGLSLAVVQGLVETHQGWIDFQSEPGEGTTFDIFFPRYVKTPTENGPDDTDALRGAETILLVDNHQPSIKNCSALLRRLGYKVVVPNPDESALDYLHENRASVDLIVLDFTLPLLTGQEILHELHERYPDMLIVLAAADPIGPALLAKQRYQAAGFVHKPYHLFELAQVVRYALDHTPKAAEQPH